MQICSYTVYKVLFHLIWIVVFFPLGFLLTFVFSVYLSVSDTLGIFSRLFASWRWTVRPDIAKTEEYGLRCSYKSHLELNTQLIVFVWYQGFVYDILFCKTIMIDEGICCTDWCDLRNQVLGISGNIATLSPVEEG